MPGRRLGSRGCGVASGYVPPGTAGLVVGSVRGGASVTSDAGVVRSFRLMLRTGTLLAAVTRWSVQSGGGVVVVDGGDRTPRRVVGAVGQAMRNGPDKRAPGGNTRTGPGRTAPRGWVSVPVFAAADRTAGRSQHEEHGTHHDHDDADRPQHGNREHEAQDQQDDAQNDHAEFLPMGPARGSSERSARVVRYRSRRDGLEPDRPTQCGPKVRASPRPERRPVSMTDAAVAVPLT